MGVRENDGTVQFETKIGFDDDTPSTAGIVFIEVGSEFDPLDMLWTGSQWVLSPVPLKSAEDALHLAARGDIIKQQILDAEAALVRPLRALVVAWAAGRQPDRGDIDMLQLRDDQINSLREELQRLPRS